MSLPSKNVTGPVAYLLPVERSLTPATVLHRLTHRH
ncbi:hypothetical protein KAURM247S_05839 [Kitasatospora aureofaciens]